MPTIFEFNKFVCAADYSDIEIDGITYRAVVHHDSDYHIDYDDSHSVDQSVTGCNDAQQAELLAARQAWLNEEWFYCGIVVSRLGQCSECGAPQNAAASLWGIEANYPGSDNVYLAEVANELLSELK